MDKFENAVLKSIRENELIRQTDAVTVAFSGGADSVCLLSVLHQLQQLLGIRLQAVHVNHQLRGGEALRDESFCRSFANDRGIRFEAIRVEVREYMAQSGMSEEEAARVLRYQVLEQSAARFAAETGGRVRIVTAHHADDQAETILMNLLRGSGLKGLGGMQPERDNIVRPLLGIGREDILKYLAGHNISYVDDSTNFENVHTRNRLRNVILPQLKAELNQRAAEHIAQTGSFAREADEYLTAEARAYISAQEGVLRQENVNFLRLGQFGLKEKPPIFRRYVIIEALSVLGVPLKDWGEKHFQDIDKALFGSKGYHLDLPGGVYLENEYRETILYYHQK